MRRVFVLNGRALPRLLPARNPVRAVQKSFIANQSTSSSQTTSIRDETQKPDEDEAAGEGLKFNNTESNARFAIYDASTKKQATQGIGNHLDNYSRPPEMDLSLEESTVEEEGASSRFPKESLTRLYESFISGETDAEGLPTSELIALGHRCVDEASPNLKAMDSIFHAILQRLPQQEGVGSEGHYEGMWVLFSLMRTISRINGDTAKWYFRDLLRSKPSWPPGSTDVIESLVDPTMIMSVFILRCCISWRWWRRAFLVSRELLSRPGLAHRSARAMHALLNEFMHQYITTAGPRFIPSLCAASICSLADHPVLPPVNDKLLQLFYKECTKGPDPHIAVASRVYLYLRNKALIPNNPQPDIKQSDNSYRPKPPHAYLPPTGRSMILLLRYYRKTNNQNAGRLLILETQRRIKSMPTPLLISYIDCLIQLSFATAAREVYSLCEASEDADRRSILHHPGTVRQLVSLFVSLANSSYQRSETNPALERRPHHAAKAVELMEFAERVVRRYKKTATKLSKWEHHHLTTLARISFEIGYFRDGIVALDAIVQRQDLLPDAYDLSVLLNALGSGDPQAALGLLEFMINRGIEPDDSAYGVVAAQCLKHNNFDLAHTVVSIGWSRGRVKWDVRLLGAISWHGISQTSLEGLTQSEVISRLLLVLRILGRSSGEGEKVFRERSLGIRGAQMSLKVGRPDIALRFWKRCIQHKSMIRQPDDVIVPLERDPEKLLRLRILEALESRKMTDSFNLSQSTKELLENVPSPLPIIQRPRSLNHRLASR